ncbi:PapD-like protein [Neocallimastix sp. 'constans']|jgi:hypothetical protein
MSTHPKFVELDPPKQLIFQRPFNTPKTRTLRIKNITDSYIIFKIKTTAPNNYIVNPNCAEIGPQSSRDIEIRRNATNEEFPPDYKCKDKFLVQSMMINEDEIIKNNTEQKEFQKYLMAKFQDMDKQKKINPVDAKKILGEDKLTCVYKLPNDNSTIPEVEEVGSSRESLANNTVDASSNVTAIPASIISSTMEATKLSSSTKNEELIAAKEKIKKLEMALDAYKKGKVGATTTSRDIKAGTTTQLAKGGPKEKTLVPVELIAIVAVLSFLIGAFCF